MSSRFNPYMLFVGSFVPNWLLQRSEVSAGAKLAYARIAQYAGRDGDAHPKLTTLAEELGVSGRMVQNYIAELERYDLIETERPGLQQPNRYYFLRHAWMTETVSNQDRKDTSTPEWTDSSTQDRQDTSTPSMKRITRRESVEESSIPPQAKRKRVLELRPTFIDEACKKYPQWDRAKVERLVDSAVNYYLPEMQRGKYQDLNLCVWNNLADKAEKETTNGPNQPRLYPAAGVFPGVAGGGGTGPLTEAERYARRVTRYQTNR